MENQGDAKLAYEQKKQEKIKERLEQGKDDNKGKSGKKVVKFLILIVVLIGLFIGFKAIIKSNSPQGEDYSQAFSSGGSQHIAIGSPLPEYSSNPPSSGSHYPSTIKGGFYENSPEDQFIIHNLEHGDIWITYKSNISEEALKLIKNFAGVHVVVSLREGNVTDIAVASWGRLDAFNESELTEQRIKDFILRYDNKGLENIRGGGPQSFK